MDSGTSQQHLDQLVSLLLNLADDAVKDIRLKENERDLFRRQRCIFSNAIKELTKLIFANAASEQDQEHYLYKLCEALGATCVIAGQRIHDEFGERFQSLAAAEKKRAISQQQGEIVAEAMKANPHPRKNPWANAGEIEQDVYNRCKAKGLPGLKRRAIARHLQKQKPA